MNRRGLRAGLAAALSIILVAAIAVVAVRGFDRRTHHTITAYFDNSNGIFPGDDVRIIGIPVGKIDTITAEPQRVKITFWVDKKYQIPADVKAAILSPSLVSARAIQLTPPYTKGAVLPPDAVIPQDRTVVPVEWDDLREQLAKLTQTLQPAAPGGTSPLGSLINTTADNLRGQGPAIRDSIIKMSQAFSILGDHSKDIFGTVKNLATLVDALQASTDLMSQLNNNLAAVSGLFSNNTDEVGRALSDLNTAVTDMQSFLTDNTEGISTASTQLASISGALVQSLYDVKQALHIGPTTFANFVNIYQPAQGALTGVLALNNFSNPVSWLCGAVQAASRLGAEQSAKLCAQYLAPIIKNRQYNNLPFGFNPFVGASARPNEITYSEDRLRPDYQPPAAPPAAVQSPADPVAGFVAEGTAQNPEATDPSQGLSGMMVPSGAGG